MERRSKIIIAGGAVAMGGLALYVAYRNRGVITSAAAPVVEAARAAVERVVAAIGKISKKTLENFAKYNVTALIDKYREGFPWAAAAGIIDIESGGYAKAENKSGATGIVQILGGKNSRGLSKEQRLDPETSLKTIMPEWRRFLQQAKDAGVTNVEDQWAYVYYGHNQGAGALKAVLPYASEGFEASLTHYRNFPWLKPSKDSDPAGHEKAVVAHIKAATAVARKAAGRGLEFAAIESKLKGGDMAGVLGSLVVEDSGWVRTPMFRGGQFAGYAQVRDAPRRRRDRSCGCGA